MNFRILFILINLIYIISCEQFASNDGFYTKKDLLYSSTNIFSLDYLPEIVISISSNEWNKLLFYYDLNPANEYDVFCDINFTDNKTNIFLKNCGLRRRGKRPEGTYPDLHNPENPKFNPCHFRLSFNKFIKGQKLFQLEAINLRSSDGDDSYIREIYSYDLMHKFGIWTAPYSSFIKLYIKIIEGNKKYYFGIYRIVEAVDDVFIKIRFITNYNGYLWKCSFINNLSADLTLSGIDAKIGIEEINNSNDNLSKKFCYDLKTKKTNFQEAKEILINFINNLNNKNGDDFKEWIINNFDVDLFIKIIAVDVLLGNWDNYWIRGHNYYLYFDDNKKCFFIPYDYDSCLGTVFILTNTGTQSIYNWGPRNITRPLVYKIFSIPEFFDKYTNYLAYLIDDKNKLFTFNDSTNRIIKWHELIRPHINNEAGQFEIIDRPALWGLCSFYRLLSGDDSGDGPEANYFKTRIKNVKLQLNLI